MPVVRSVVCVCVVCVHAHTQGFTRTQLSERHGVSGVSSESSEKPAGWSPRGPPSAASVPRLAQRAPPLASARPGGQRPASLALSSASFGFADSVLPVGVCSTSTAPPSRSRPAGPCEDSLGRTRPSDGLRAGGGGAGSKPRASALLTRSVLKAT